MVNSRDQQSLVELKTLCALGHVRSSRSRIELVRGPLPLGRVSYANCSVALRSSSGSVRCIKHNYPDHHDKSEGQKRGQRHKLLP